MFRDRCDAGRRLAERLQQFAGRPDVLIIALPRGGVPVGFEIAQRLNSPLDIRVVRKIGAPGQPEFAIGAIAAGVEILNPASIRELRLSPDQVARVVDEERQELARREAALRGKLPPIAASGKHAIVVDDGLATGSTMRVAIGVLRAEQAIRVTVAVPVGAGSVVRHLAQTASELICLCAPKDFDAVSKWYADFEQVSDQQVRELLARSARSRVDNPGTEPR